MSHKNSSNSYNPGNTSLHNKGKAWLALAFIMLIVQIYIVYCSYIKATVLFWPLLPSGLTFSLWMKREGKCI